MSACNHSNPLRPPLLSPGSALPKHQRTLSTGCLLQALLAALTWSQMSSHFFSLSYCRSSRALSGGKFIAFCRERKKANVRDHSGLGLGRSQTRANQDNVAAVALIVLWESPLTELFRNIPSQHRLWPQKQQ